MTQIKLFEYDQIDGADSDFIRDRTIEIKALVKRSAQDIIEIGLKLIEVKDRLPHGMWGKWLDVEFGWTNETARRFMNVASKFNNLLNLDSFGQSALYLLASPSTPDEAREEALNRASNGEVITHKAAKEIVNSYKEDEPPEDEPELIYGGGYAYCKYCYETHNQWELSADHSPTAWECQRCGHFTADQYMDLREKPIFTCPECDQTFNSEVWHCLDCDSHWQPSQRDCPNCYKDKLGEKKTSDAKKPHVARTSGENEWYTPENLIEAARRVLGQIELDPASSEVANTVVKAAKYYDINTDGLLQPWRGKVWLNPPYKTGLIEKFTEKLAAEFELGNVNQFIILVNNATETKWFNSLAESSSVVCFVTSRVKYWSPNRDSHTPLQGQAILYGGNAPQNFIDNFREFGFVARLIH